MKNLQYWLVGIVVGVVLGIAGMKNACADPVVIEVPAHTVVLYQTTDETTAACGVRESDGSLIRSAGCTMYYADGRIVVVIQQPESWCDVDRLDTAGHEYLHLLGFKHRANLQNSYLADRDYGCRNGTMYRNDGP